MLFLTVSVMFCSCGGGNSDKTETKSSAKVGNVEISQNKVEQRLNFNLVRNAAFRETVNSSFTDKQEIEKQLKNVILPENKNDVLEELIDYQLIEKYLQENNLLKSFEECKEQAKKEIDNLKKDEAQNSFYKNLVKALKSSSLTENESFEINYDFAYDYYNCLILKRNLNDNSSDSSEKQEQKFEDFVKQLRSKEKIEYK